MKKKTKVILIGVAVIVFLALVYTLRYFYLIRIGSFSADDPFWVKAAVTSGLAEVKKDWIEF
ncbi:MAG: hypothetical protein AMJ95_08815 [Omnitrophica WOR_2 bacterium SM23_72]|nr:MAG: hypothetical protein AMJ95_08815 [Omnitrophica WOR_2 bacterium SM23_72]